MMADDRFPDENNAQPEDGSGEENRPTSPSTIFLEMMREAAARQQTQQSRSMPASDDPRPARAIRANPASPAGRTAPPETRSRMPIYTLPDDAGAGQEDEAPAEPIRRVAALEAQRQRRLERRRQRRQRRNVGILGGFFRTIFITFFAAGLASTIFTWFTEPNFLRPEVATNLVVADATLVVDALPTALPTPNWLRRIGIVSGHRGPENDPGAVCPDGLTEAEINFNVASIMVRELRALGYSVDLLDEFDPRLDNYQAAALVSIHANTCQDFGEVVSGFLVAKAAARPEGGRDTELAECLAMHYAQRTQLQRRFTLTLDMTDYHTFREIHPLTPAAIMELGFMKDDRQLLTGQPELLAEALVQGVQCFLQPTGAMGIIPSATATAQARQAAGG